MFKIFPASLINGEKVPLIRGWNELATTDPVQIKLWQDQFRERISFWGVPCGTVNGVLVLDIDVKKGVDGWKTIREKNLLITDTLNYKTLTGGSHFYFKYPNDGKKYGNRVKFLPGLDTRGYGGWVAFHGIDIDWSKPILDAPDWLLQHAYKEEKPNDQPTSTIKLAPEIAQKIFQTSIDAIRTAPEGESNNTLNVEAFKVGQLVASGSVPREFAEIELFKAAKERGKPDYEARATIKSGLDGGLKHPLTNPFPTNEPVPQFQLPAPPETPTRWTPAYMTRSDLLNTSKLRKPQLFQDWSTEDIQITTADGGTGKTTLKLYEAICLALGDRFLGFANVQRGKTLFITGEDTAAKLSAMIGAIMGQMGILNGSPENEAKIDCILSSVLIKKDSDLCLITQDKQGFLHPNSGAMEKLLQAIDDIKPKMIVFDPISSFWGSEMKLNDMNKAVTKFMSELSEKGKCCVEMINHMGKSSSASKDMSQFAGRGGSGLPSNSRVSRVLRSVPADEYEELTGMPLIGDNTAMMCNVNKFSDGSVLLNKQFLIIRDRYLFSRLTLSPTKARELEKQLDDKERVFTWVKQQRLAGKYPGIKNVIGHFMNNGNPLSEARIKRACNMLEFDGHLGEKFIQVDNPDLTKNDKVIVIGDIDGKEL